MFDRLVERLSASPVLGPVIGSGPAVALAAALIVGALLAVRVAQGQPPARDWSGTVSAASSSRVHMATAGSDDLVVVAAPGDSLWSIAERYAPGHDRRDAVATLADLNGGSTVQVGQQIVVPRELLD
jgi:predicted RecA/RadA family phage recombinase